MATHRSHHAGKRHWLAIDPKGYAGDSAYDAITVLGSHHEALLAAPDPKSALLHCLAIFADAAEIDPERARRWTQARAVTAAFWGRRHDDPHWLVQANDLIAKQLA
jgi:streptomycin 6-kinase